MKLWMKNMLVTGLLVSQVANAETGSIGAHAQLIDEVGLTPPAVHRLDLVEQNSTRAGIAPLAFALGVASIDLALMGIYYGVYVPYYTSQDPSFNYNIN